MPKELTRVKPPRKRKKRGKERQPLLWGGGRVLVWFSCGASSAVALKLAVEEFGAENVFAFYCDTSEDEHEDNMRFLRDVEIWTGKTIEKVRSDKFANCFDVYEQTGFIVSPEGARCTGELKKAVGHKVRKMEDVNIYGFTADAKEVARAETYLVNNFDQQLDFILIRHGVTKARCFEILEEAGIKPSAMYALGFNNANCRGCVKVRSMNYWLKVRHYWPDRFARLAEISRAKNVALVRYQKDKRTVHLFLDELPADALPDLSDVTGEEGVECGVLCGPAAPEPAGVPV